MREIIAATTFALLLSATTLPAQWSYRAASVERHPMTDRVIQENPAKASISYRVFRPARGMIDTRVVCMPSGSARLEFVFTNLYEGPNLIGTVAGETLRVRFRFDDEPVTDWQEWVMYPYGPSLRGVKVIPLEGPLSIEALRKSREMRVEFRNTRTLQNMIISDETVSGRTLPGSNAAIGRLPCVR